MSVSQVKHQSNFDEKLAFYQKSLVLVLLKGKSCTGVYFSVFLMVYKTSLNLMSSSTLRKCIFDTASVKVRRRKGN